MTRNLVVLRFLLDELKQSTGAYGYDFWLPNSVEQGFFLWNCAVAVLTSEPPPPYAAPEVGMGRRMIYGAPSRESKTAEEIFPLAADILWLICVRGILRPGVRRHDGQVVTNGEGYSLTLKGREWVKNYSEDDLQELLGGL